MSRPRVHLVQHRGPMTYCYQYHHRVARVAEIRNGIAYGSWLGQFSTQGQVVMYEDICKYCGQHYTKHTGIPYVSLCMEDDHE